MKLLGKENKQSQTLTAAPDSVRPCPWPKSAGQRVQQARRTCEYLCVPSASGCPQAAANYGKCIYEPHLFEKVKQMNCSRC